MVALRECIFRVADDQASTTGTHPAWKSVKSDSPSKWPMYEGVAKAVPVEAPTATKKK